MLDFNRRASIIAAFAVLLVISTKTAVTGESSRDHDTINTIPSICIMAVYSALEDLRDIFSKNPDPQYPDFFTFFELSYEGTACQEKDDFIVVDFYSKRSARGGGITYYIDRNTYVVERRILGL